MRGNSKEQQHDNNGCGTAGQSRMQDSPMCKPHGSSWIVGENCDTTISAGYSESDTLPTATYVDQSSNMGAVGTVTHIRVNEDERNRISPLRSVSESLDQTAGARDTKNGSSSVVTRFSDPRIPVRVKEMSSLSLPGQACTIPPDCTSTCPTAEPSLVSPRRTKVCSTVRRRGLGSNYRSAQFATDGRQVDINRHNAGGSTTTDGDTFSTFSLDICFDTDSDVTNRERHDGVSNDVGNINHFESDYDVIYEHHGDVDFDGDAYCEEQYEETAVTYVTPLPPRRDSRAQETVERE